MKRSARQIAAILLTAVISICLMPASVSAEETAAWITAKAPIVSALGSEPKSAAEIFAASTAGTETKILTDIADDPDSDDEEELTALSGGLPPEETLTGEIFREFLSSEYAQRLSEFYTNKRRFWLDPLSNGNVEFSEPFRIPIYRKDAKNSFEPVMYTWYTAIFQNGKIYGLMKTEYNFMVLPQRCEFLPYDVTESINNGNDLSLYIVYAEVDGKIMGEFNVLYYSIDKTGKSTLINKELSLDLEVSNPDPVKTDKNDYALISGYNVLSKNMKKAASAKNKYSADLKEGCKITLQNFSEKYLDTKTSSELKYKSKRNYIVHEAGKDESGEMTYKLSSIKSPDKTLKFAGNERFCLRMSSGATEPLYRICPVTDADKALTLSNGKLKLKKRTDASEQLWFISISE